MNCEDADKMLFSELSSAKAYFEQELKKLEVSGQADQREFRKGTYNSYILELVVCSTADS